ncbi:MAG: molybdopterin molybdotransferase MoeA [Thermoleophilia bacterium]
MTPPRAVSPARALEAARAMAPATPGQEVAFTEAVGRRLAEAVTAARDLPAADAAAMDGWAVRASGAVRRVRVAGESVAGRPFPGAVPDGGACRIATGALLPPGTDAVLRLEDGSAGADGVLVVPPLAPGRDVRPRASEVAAGTVVFPAGHLLRAHDLGVLAAIDRPGVRCHRRVRVALVGSGDELVDPGDTGGRPEVVIDSNVPMLAAQVAAAGGELVHAARVPDGPGDLERGIAAARAANPDVLVTVGGASVGDRDHVRRTLGLLGAVALADGLLARPGHPVWLGALDGMPVLALPGNPGAAQVMFHLLGRALLGVPDPWTPTVVAREIRGRERDDLFVRCAATPEGLVPLEDQRPASVRALGTCDALAWVPAGGGVAAGGPVAASRLA